MLNANVAAALSCKACFAQPLLDQLHDQLICTHSYGVREAHSYLTAADTNTSLHDTASRAPSWLTYVYQPMLCLQDYHVTNSSLTQLTGLRELQIKLTANQPILETENLSGKGLPFMPYLTKLVLEGGVSPTCICYAN
jgi:hypothetical protein